jgi:hypothetical protein
VELKEWGEEDFLRCLREGVVGSVLVGWLGKEMQCLREGVVGSDLIDGTVDEDEVALVAARYLPPKRGTAAVFREASKEEIGATDGGGEIGVGASAEGVEGRDLVTAGVDEEPKELRRVLRLEAATEGGGGSDGVEEGAAGDGGADEAREGREENEDLAEEVFADISNGGGSRWPVFRRRWR